MNLSTYLKQQWDRVGSWVLIGVGALVLLLGWLGISGTPHVAAQLPYIISGGLFGVFLLGIGGMLWVSADLKDEWRELHGIRAAIDKVVETTELEAHPTSTRRRYAPDDVVDMVDLGADDLTGPIERTPAAKIPAGTLAASNATASTTARTRARRPARAMAGKAQ